ncbi:hypothetical protein MMC07_006048 [Pseudocyphellaria aurata]|nr:hypothetical protein [Pseudocyphellaria aurata]
MEESTSESNEFIIPDLAGYAWMDIATCEAADFLMTLLEPVEMKDLDPDDRLCTICQEEFYFSESLEISHTPVKTPCGHVFGHNCLMTWHETMYAWSNSDPKPDADDFDIRMEMSNASCPNCRRECFPRQLKDSVEALEHRIAFWDVAYASAGVTRTEKETRCRDHVVRYIKYFNVAHKLEPLHIKLMWELDGTAQIDLLDFTNFQKAQRLSSELENRRIRLERIAKKNLSKCCNLIGGGYGYEYAFDINRDDDERDEFKGKPIGKAFLKAD